MYLHNQKKIFFKGAIKFHYFFIKFRNHALLHIGMVKKITVV